MRIQKVSAVLILTFLHLASAKVDDWFIQIEEIEITKGTIHILHNFCVFFFGTNYMLTWGGGIQKS